LSAKSLAASSRNDEIGHTSHGLTKHAQAREGNWLPTSQGKEHADAALLGDIRGDGLLV
jgi:hypothetical protein